MNKIKAISVFVLALLVISLLTYLFGEPFFYIIFGFFLGLVMGYLAWREKYD